MLEGLSNVDARLYATANGNGDGVTEYGDAAEEYEDDQDCGELQSAHDAANASRCSAGTG